jgi:hypothetical protein
VTFKGGLAALYRANLHLRTTSRILARLGNFFYATSFTELQKRASRLPWERFITPGQPIALHVTCHKSQLFHSDAVARTIMAGVEERLGQSSSIVKMDALTGIRRNWLSCACPMTDARSVLTLRGNCCISAVTARRLPRRPCARPWLRRC